jgi:hypothetical protein
MSIPTGRLQPACLGFGNGNLSEMQGFLWRRSGHGRCGRRAVGGRDPSSKVAVIVIVLTVGLACSVEAAALADAAKKGMWGPPTHNGISLFPIYNELGVTLYEDDLHWNAIATRRPRHPRNPRDAAYAWPAEVTRAVNEARRYSMQVALQIIGAPRWANGNKPPRWATFDTRRFADFAIAAARRYPSVHLWMIWGEPSRSKDFRPLTPAPPFTPLTGKQVIAPHLYSRILDSAYGALKSVSPANVVIGGMTDTAASISPQQWIENMRMPDGRPPRLDMYGHNPFTSRAPNLANPPSPGQQLDFSDLARLAAAVDANLGRAENPQPKLFLSEWTIPTAVDREFNFYVDPRVQALWITQGLRIVRQDPRVFALGWIHLYDAPPQATGGLIQANGKRKPGFFAWKEG